MPGPELHAAVVGGSLSGLCAGLALARAGWSVTIIERATGEQPGGAGLGLDRRGGYRWDRPGRARQHRGCLHRGCRGGADGVYSVTRRFVSLGHPAASYAGYMLWRGLVSGAEVPGGLGGRGSNLEVHAAPGAQLVI